MAAQHRAAAAPPRLPCGDRGTTSKTIGGESVASDEERAADDLERDDVPADRGAPPDSVERVERDAWTEAENRRTGVGAGGEREADEHPSVVDPAPSDD
jgi:hypothetical protein